MAAEVGQRFSGWSYSELPYNDHSTQDASVQQMVHDHGSVSFGRFASESLSWEKRSVFAHNRRQEEISKLTAPGLVAQKKAFFEEYYKRARQLKAQGTAQQAEATLEAERSNENTLVHSSQAEQVTSEDQEAGAPSSSFVPSSEVSSSDERKGHDSHELGYLTFNPLFSQTANLQGIQQEERASSGQKQYLDREFPCAVHTSSKHHPLERKVLEPRLVVSDENDASHAAGSRIVLPVASVHSEAQQEKQAARKTRAVCNRPMKRPKELSTSVIHIPRVDLRRNSENRPSQDLNYDPFHKRVEMKLRALSDRMSADRATTSSRSASYQPPYRASRSSYQNADTQATSSRSSLCQNTDRVLAPSKSAGQASHKSHKDVRRREYTLHSAISVNKGSRASHVASNNSTATGKSAAKILMMRSSSQVNANTSRTAQVTLKKPGLTGRSNGSQNKRKQLSTPAALNGNNPKRGNVRISAPPSARSSTDNLPPASKAPKISNRKNVTKTEVVQKSTYASHPIAGGRNFATKRTVSCNEQSRKVMPSRIGSLAGTSARNNLKGGPSLAKNKPREAEMAMSCTQRLVHTPVHVHP
ncbi:hypothetical protein ACP4OV_006415 [Aristida adscensionis]